MFSDASPVGVVVREWPVLGLRAHEINVEEWHSMTARGQQIVEHTEPPRRRDSPRQHVLSPHAVLELFLALEHQHAAAAAGNRRRQCRPGKAAADCDDVQDPMKFSW